MSFKLLTNKGRLTNFNAPLMLCKDAAGKTFLAGFWRENGVLVFRYYRKSEITAVTPVNGVYPSVGYFKNDLTVAESVVTALTLDEDPDGVALAYQAGKASDYFPEITNLNWTPTSAALDSITVAVINGSGSGNGGSGNGTALTFDVTGNGDGTITVSGIMVGDLISVDGGTVVTATDTTYTTAKQKDGTHTVVVTAGTAGYSYTVTSKTVTTKIAFLSAPLDFVTENPVLTVGVAIAAVLLIWYVIVPMVKGESIGGGSPKKTVSARKRNFISL